MNEMLEKILNEVQGLKKEMNLRFKEQDERIEARFKEQDERIEARFKEQDERIEARFKEQDERIESRFKQQDDRISAEFKIIYEKFDTQTKEIAQELRTMADFIYERDKKLIKGLEKKIDQEIEYNKAAHEVYDARFRKLELGQASLEARVTELERVRKVS